jgi:hypothetical protein
MKKTSTVRINGNVIFKGRKLTTGLDLGDRWSNYCVLDEAGEVLVEQKLATTPEAVKQTFEKIPRSLIARARREKCQETSGCCGGPKVGGTATSVVGKWRGVRTTAQ